MRELDTVIVRDLDVRTLGGHRFLQRMQATRPPAGCSGACVHRLKRAVNWLSCGHLLSSFYPSHMMQVKFFEHPEALGVLEDGAGDFKLPPRLE